MYPVDNEAAARIDKLILIQRNHTDDVYLKKLKEALIRAIENFKPEFVIFNSGTDILKGDKLGRLSISAQGIIKRDEIVFNHCLYHDIPIVMLMSGGY